MQPKKNSAIDIIIVVIIVLVIFFLTLHLAVSYDNVKGTPIIKNSKELLDWKSLFVDFSTRISEKPHKLKYSESTLLFLAVSSFIILLSISYFMTTKKKYISGKEYGTATWGNSSVLKTIRWKYVKKDLIKDEKKTFNRKKHEIKKDKNLKHSEKINEINDAKLTLAKNIEKLKLKIDTSSEIILSQDIKFCRYNREINNNILVVGGAGSGKTRGIVAPNILQATNKEDSPSFVITDPKGEVLLKTGRFLEDKGYRVRAVNFFELEKSSCYNPFVYINPKRESFEDDVIELIETIIYNTSDKDKKGGDQFWDNAEKLFLQAIFFFVAVGYTQADRTMNTVMDLIRKLELKEENDDRNSPLDKMFVEFAKRFGDDHIAVKQFEEFRSKASGKTAKSIVITAVARLSKFNSKQIQRIFSKDELQLDKVGEEKTALFIIVPPMSDAYNFASGIIFTQLFQQLNYCANAKYKGILPHQVMFVLDEFANTCKIPRFPQIIAYARSLGISIVPILQSLTQLKAMYEKEWQVIFDNCSSFVYLGAIKNIDDLKIISELLGEGTFDKKTSSRSKGKQSSTSSNEDKLGRALMKPDELAKISRKKSIIIMTGYDPFFSSKYNYHTHKNYKFTSDGNKRNVFIYRSPHGEEVKDDFSLKSVSKKSSVKEEKTKIIVDTNIDNSLKFLEENLLVLDYDSTSINITEEELEDINSELEIIKNTDSNISIKDMLSNLEKNSEVIQVNKDEEAIKSTIEDMINIEKENPNSINFDDFFNEEYEDDYNLLLNKDMDELLDDITNLTDELSNIANLQNIDISFE